MPVFWELVRPSVGGHGCPTKNQNCPRADTWVRPYTSDVAAPHLTVLYDDDCGVCRKCAAWVSRTDTLDLVTCLPAISAEVQKQFPHLPEEDLLRDMHTVRDDGVVFTGADGWREILRRLPRWRWLAALWWVPGAPAIARVLYRQVADNRPRACRVPG